MNIVHVNSIIVLLAIKLIVFLVSIFFAFLEHHPDSKKEKALFAGAIILACTSFVSFFLDNDVPSPHIDREGDYSAVVLSTDEPMKIEYRISTNGNSSDEWMEYEKPFKLERNAIVYARASTLWFTSEQSFRDVYVAENGLVYFSDAEAPGDTIVSIEAAYNHRDAVVNVCTSNHYDGYEIKKDDIIVVGTDLKGNKKELDDFKYSPKILKTGKNSIEIEYLISNDISVKSHLYVNANIPSLIKLNAKYRGGKVYLDTVLDKDDFVVEGIYEDGTVSAITEYSISSTELREGRNVITITKDGLSDAVEFTAIDRDTITEYESEPNEELKYANEIDVNVKYSGTLNEDGDVDYFKLSLDKKGKLTIQLTHPKIDEGGDFWIVSLLSQDEDVRVEMRSSGREVETKSSPARVMPGVYYVKVSDYYHSSEKYTMTILFEEEDGSYENEPNNDLSSQAMVINLDKEYIGNLTTQNDIDYYKFSIDEKRKVWIDFSHDKTSESGTLWKVSLFGDFDGSILDFDSSGENAKISSNSVRLPSGNYYIRISDYYWSDLDYTFCVHSQEEGAETETEDNGDYGSASAVAIGSSIIGNIQSENDVDFYKFEWQSTMPLKVTFTHNRVDSGNIFWQFELYNEESSNPVRNNENSESVIIRGDASENVISEWNSLPVGTYYLKVHNYYFINDDYKITLSN